MLSRASLLARQPQLLQRARLVAPLTILPALGLTSLAGRGFSSSGGLYKRSDKKKRFDQNFEAYRRNSEYDFDQPRRQEPERPERSRPKDYNNNNSPRFPQQTQQPQRSTDNGPFTQTRRPESEQRPTRPVEPDSTPTEAEDINSSTDQKFELPDLTKGIPSTIGAELERIEKETRQASYSSELDVSPNLPHSQEHDSRGPSQLPKSSYVSSVEQRRNRLAKFMATSFLLLAIAIPIYFGRNWDTEEEEDAHKDAPSGWGVTLFWNRVKSRSADFFDFYTEPAFPKLLPDTEKAWERPYTLVLSLEDLLVHSEWTRENGWRTAKRPGVDYFLQYLSQYYELVVFTSLPSHIADPIIKKLDPFHFIMWPLFREATRYKNGKHIKVINFSSEAYINVIGSFIPQSATRENHYVGHRSVSC
jgi:import inner membrane translocase subunit TIM50